MEDREMDPDDPRRFAEQPWEVWAAHLGRWGPIPDPPEPKRERGVTLLPREDMGLYGFCPEWDPFYTVVCEQCQKVVKPQGLARHYSLWHPDFKVKKTEESPEIPAAAVEPADITENKAELVVEPTIMVVENKAEKWSPLPSTSSSSTGFHENETSSVIQEQMSESQETDFLQAEGDEYEDDCIILESPKTSPVTSPKEMSAMEPFVVMTRLPSPSKLPNYVAKFAAHSKPTHRVSASRKRLKTVKAFKEREYDPDRHCGVWIEEQRRACTRSLTCKSHALSMRRAVIGRSMSFDKLLAEHRAAKECKLPKQSEQALAPELGTSCLGTTSHEVKANAVSSEPSGVDDGAVRLTPFSPCDRPPVLQTTAATSSVHRPAPTLPDLTIDTFESLDVPIPSEHSLFTTVVARFTPEQNPRPPEENILRVSAKIDELHWQKVHPKPRVVPGLIARKCGGISWSGRRIGLFRHGLQTALTQGYIRIPLSNDYYGVPLQYPTNHATSTMKTVLTNISTKGNMLSVSNKLLGPNCTSKSLQVTTNSSRKLNQIHSPLSAAIMNSGSLKTVLPKPSVLATKTVNHSTNTTELSVKNGQFHVPNILSASLKRPLETVKSNAGVSVKRSKRKNCVNPNEVLSSLLARKNHISSASNTVPLVTVALSNGVTVGNSGSSQVEGSETKTIFTSQSVVVPEGLLSELPKAITSNSVATLPESASGNTAVKAQAQAQAQAQTQTAASQSSQLPNLQIAATRGTLQLASPQITYLTGPVTFQQIPVLSSQVISQIQLQSKNNSSPSSIPLKLLSQSTGIEFSSPHSVVVHSDLEQASTET